jgi:hypothetical protein
MAFKLSKISPVRPFTITLSSVRIGSMIWKFIRNKGTQRLLLSKDVTYKEMTSAIMAPMHMAGVSVHKYSILGVEIEDIRMCK